MKSRTLICITAMVLFAALALPVTLKAQHTRYKVVDLGTFNGGPNSFFPGPEPPAQDVNNRGTAAGTADTPVPDPFFPNCFGDCFVQHAFQWQNGALTDLGVLPGGSSSGAAWISANGLIVSVDRLPGGSCCHLDEGPPDSRPWNASGRNRKRSHRCQ
jgi:hypothetical protein